MPDSVQRALAAVLTVLTLPLVAVLALAIRLESRGPILYRATRVGAGGRVFTCYKLRSMSSRASAGSPLTVREDARVTRVGRVLRGVHLDELPQLWNVVRGEMRLVGPRPEDPRYVDFDDPSHREVFSATPGMTGLAQLVFQNEAALLDRDDPDRSYRERILSPKVALDRLYLARRSTRFDLWILGRTVMAIVGSSGLTPAEIDSCSERFAVHDPVVKPVIRTAETAETADDEAARIRAVYERRDRRGPRHLAIAEAYVRINKDRLERMRSVIAPASRATLPRILDVGCGTGFDLAFWLSSGWPADALSGVDLSRDRIAEARLNCPGVDIQVTSGTTLPFPDAVFDVATAVTVFSSILDGTVRRALFEEMRRVVRPGGIVLAYDFVVRKPSNHDVIPMDLVRLRALGTRPSTSVRLTPLLHLVALGTKFGGVGTSIAMRVAPRTHRLTCWRIPGP